MGESLKKLVGQVVLVENKPGAAGQIAYTDFKNNAKPDGYTISQVSSPHIHAIVLDTTRKAAFTMKDFQPVANQVQDPGAILVRPDSPYKTLDDLLAAAKANPGQIKVSSTGLGGDDHLAILNVQHKSGLRFNIIHTAGSPQAMAAVLGGHIDVNFDNIGGFLAPVKSGQARLLAVMMDKRHPEFPDVPTFREKGHRRHIRLDPRLLCPGRDTEGDRTVPGREHEEGHGGSGAHQAGQRTSAWS